MAFPGERAVVVRGRGGRLLQRWSGASGGAGAAGGLAGSMPIDGATNSSSRSSPWLEPSGPPPSRSSSLESGCGKSTRDVRARVVVVPDQVRLLGGRLEHLQQLLVVAAEFVDRGDREPAQLEQVGAAQEVQRVVVEAGDRGDVPGQARHVARRRAPAAARPRRAPCRRRRSPRRRGCRGCGTARRRGGPATGHRPREARSRIRAVAWSGQRSARPAYSGRARALDGSCPRSGTPSPDAVGGLAGRDAASQGASVTSRSISARRARCTPIRAARERRRCRRAVTAATSSRWPAHSSPRRSGTRRRYGTVKTQVWTRSRCEEVGDVGVADQAAELAPEAQVVADEDVEVAAAGGPRGLLGPAAYRGQATCGSSVAAAAARRACRNSPSTTRLRASIMRAEVVDGELVDLEAAVLVDVEQPLRATGRRRASRTGVAETPYCSAISLTVNSRPGRQPPGEHLVTQRVGDLLPQGAAGDGLLPVRGHRGRLPPRPSCHVIERTALASRYARAVARRTRAGDGRTGRLQCRAECVTPRSATRCARPRRTAPRPGPPDPPWPRPR